MNKRHLPTQRDVLNLLDGELQAYVDFVLDSVLQSDEGGWWTFPTKKKAMEVWGTILRPFGIEKHDLREMRKVGGGRRRGRGARKGSKKPHVYFLVRGEPLTSSAGEKLFLAARKVNPESFGNVPENGDILIHIERKREHSRRGERKKITIEIGKYGNAFREHYLTDDDPLGLQGNHKPLGFTIETGYPSEDLVFELIMYPTEKTATILSLDKKIEQGGAWEFMQQYYPDVLGPNTNIFVDFSKYPYQKVSRSGKPLTKKL